MVDYTDPKVRENMYWMAGNLLEQFGERFAYSPEYRKECGFEKQLGDYLAQLVIDWRLS
jgi:hypothetical protein